MQTQSACGHYTIFRTEKEEALRGTEDINRRSEKINNPIGVRIFYAWHIKIFEQKIENQDIFSVKFVVYNKAIENVKTSS